MQNTSPAAPAKAKTTQRLEDARAVAVILEQIPDLLKVKEVRKRDGSTVPFAVERIGMAFAGALKEAGINDDFLLARCTHLALTRIEKQFGADGTPTTEELSRVVVSVLIDQNLHFAVKHFFASLGEPTPALAPRLDGKGLRFKPTFTRKGEHPYLKIAWEKRDAVITDAKGINVFEQKDVEVPKSWSQTATNIVASKYFRGQIGTPERETSVRQLVDRVAKTVTDWGRTGNYFASNDDATAFEYELTHILVNQMAAFNSPVYFNVGVTEHPQCSACFINSVRDDMRSIMNLAVTEAMLFKGGSGTGTNLSTLRSSKENLRGSSGKSSGPVSFMKGFDAFAGVVKSGGKTRRAAKMVILNVDHPDVESFVSCKADEERKARALIEAGYDAGIGGSAYDSVFFQNANNSVRVNDDFMRAFESDGPWETRAVVTGETVDRLRARDLMGKIAKAAWECGDPGVQYDTTINKWHTCPNSGRINASNPCVTGDTLVSTAEGYRTIAELVGKRVEVIDANGDVSPVSEVFPTGRKQVYTLRTKSGYVLRLTGDHKVWTVNRGDVPACELREGDELQLRQPGFGTQTLDERLAESLGLAVGDGCVVKSDGRDVLVIAGHKDETRMLEHVNQKMNVYKRKHAVDGRGARQSFVHHAASTARISTGNGSVLSELQRYAVLNEGSEKKRFKNEFFALDKSSQAAVLRGLFTADGTVADYGEKSQCVGLDSVSLELLRQVQLLLLGFGIKAKIYENRRANDDGTSMLPDGRGGTAEYPVQQVHSLRISRSSRVTFQEEIGFVHYSDKANKLSQMNWEVATYADKMTDGFLSLTEEGIEDVYDLTEPRTSHFVANGLVVHNCSEYMFLDDTACNLASLNLQKFVREDGSFDVAGFKHAAEVVITAMEIIVGNSSYPTPAIEENSHAFRPLGIGYANLGALLMSRGLAYDSDEGRNFAAAISSLLSGQCYAQSAAIAEAMGPFRGYKVNEKPFLKVIGMHRDAAIAVPAAGVPADLHAEARAAWDRALEGGMAHGYRNSQISVLAPTGTISLMMDCDTTGIEPDLALVKYKWLVGGGLLKIVNQSVPSALTALEYAKEQIDEILAHIDANETIEGAPHLRAEHLPVFDCAFKPAKGSRSIHYMGHVRMMAAVQPFISGAISKTVNLPQSATVEEVQDAYLQGWKLGLKAIAIYRDGSKGQQVLTTDKEKSSNKTAAASAPSDAETSDSVAEAAETVIAATHPKKPAADAAPLVAPITQTIVETRVEYRPLRRRLPDERRSMTHKFSVGGHEGYVTVGLYDDGMPGEIFIRMAKGGTVVSGLMDAFATSTSIAMQYGVPLKVLVNKFVHVRFEPSGYTSHPNIRIAKSIVDYLFRWMALKFLPIEDQRAVGLNLDAQTLGETGESEVNDSSVPSASGDAADASQMKISDAAAKQPTMTFDGGSAQNVKHAPDVAPKTVANPERRRQDRRETGSADPLTTSNALSMSFDVSSDAPACDTCGAIMVRNAACYKCLNCGASSGCS